jgi:cyclophilin family peptidyl-prolyl cis-trans isomerase
MGKWTDKLYITRSECLSGEFFGASNTKNGKSSLPICDREEECISLDICSLSLQPWIKPVCTSEGIIYDYLTILEYIDHNSFDPITKQPLDHKSLIEIQNYDPQTLRITCPVTFKDLTFSSDKAVLLRPSGYIYECKVIDGICKEFPSSEWKDPMTDLPFKRSDIISLQRRSLSLSPNNPESIKTPLSVPLLTASNASTIPESLNPASGSARVSIRFNLYGDLHFELFTTKGHNTTPQLQEACRAFIKASLDGLFVDAPVYKLHAAKLLQAGRLDQTENIILKTPMATENHQHSHNQRGLLGLVNKRMGKFVPHIYITFGPTPSLDGMNIVIGKVTAGWNVLQRLENDTPIKTGTQIPARDLLIQDIIVVDNPFI